MRFLFLVIIFFLLVLPLAAQPGNGPGDPGDPVPITGIEFLLGLGGLVGVGSRWKSIKKRFLK